MSRFKVAVCTLGCKVNYYESQIITQLLRNNNFKICDMNEICDAYVVNSCSVTADTDRKVFKLIRRLIRTNPCAIICVTGCMAQLRPDDIAKMQTDSDIIVCGNENKQVIVDKLLKRINEKRKNERKQEVFIKDFTDTLLPTKLEGFSRTRVYIKIEDGCDAKCAYCTICKARGPVRIRPVAECVEEIKCLADRGCKEVVLTGIELSAYPFLPELISEIDKINGIERVRLSSIDPFYLKKEIVDKLSESSKIMPHFHISLQSGSSRILAKMRRKYNSVTAHDNLMYLKSKFKNCMLFADIIVGFPTETNEEFMETVDFIKKIRFLHLHIFPYSKRSGTEAAVMEGQIPENIKNDRAAQLAEIQSVIKKQILEEFISINDCYEVLVETQKDCIAIGHTREFFEVNIQLNKQQSLRDYKGNLVNVIIKKTDGDIMQAVLA